MKYSVGFEDKQLVFSDAAPVGTDGVTVVQDEGPFPVTKLLQIVGNNKTLWVISPDPAASFRAFRGQYRVVEAAGGLVTDPDGNVLMIRRRDRWDLPKGHCELGETALETGIREVQEECGIGEVEGGALIAETWHGYRLDGEWVLKRTSWFRMRLDGRQRTVRPQTEEGITAVEWVRPEELSERLAGTYPTIRQVFSEAGYEV